MSRQRLGELRLLYKQAVNELISEEKVDSSQRVALLNELVAMEQEFIEARKRVNASVSFLRLPCELIGEIAATLACVWPPAVRHCKLHSTDQKPTVGWILLSHVCHPLRVILLGIPSLWAQTTQYLGISGQSALLQRAGSAPVSLSVGLCQCSHTEQSLTFMSNTLARAREISTSTCNQKCGFPAPAWCISPAEFSAKTFPFLEEIRLQLDGEEAYYAVSWIKITTDIFCLPPIVAPRLRRLTLYDFYIPFSGSLCSLTYLCLARLSGHALPKPSQFLDLLRSCNKLQELALLYWIPDISSSATLAISFPFLKKLHIRDAFIRCLHFWTQVDIPPMAQQEIAFSDISSEADNYIDMIATGITNRIQAPIRSLFIDYPNNEINIAFSDSQVSALYLQTDDPWDNHNQIHSAVTDNANFSLDLCIQKEYSDLDDDGISVEHRAIVQYTLRHYNLASNLGFLHLPPYEIFTDFMTPHEELRTLLLPFVNLHTLFVTCENFESLICPLIIPSLGDTPFLPCLRFLWCDYLDVATTLPPSYWPGQPHDVSKFPFFLEMLSSRARAGKGLEWVKIGAMWCSSLEDFAYIHSTGLSSIRAIVPNFETTIEDPDLEEDSDAAVLPPVLITP